MQTELVSNEKRSRVLEYLLEHPTEEIKIRKIAAKLKLNPGFVSVFIKKLRKERIVKKESVDKNSSMVKAWKILFNISKITKHLNKLLRIKSIDGIGIYGSWAIGTNNEESDIDLWIKVKKYPEAIEIARIRKVIRENVGVEPSIMIITKEKMEELKRKNPPIYFSLMHSFHLWGENVD